MANYKKKTHKYTFIRRENRVPIAFELKQKKPRTDVRGL